MCIFSIAAVKSELYYITATTDKRKFPIYFASAWRMVILKRKSYDIIPQLFKLSKFVAFVYSPPGPSETLMFHQKVILSQVFTFCKFSFLTWNTFSHYLSSFILCIF